MSLKQSSKILVITLQTHGVDDEFKLEWQTGTYYCQATLFSPHSSPAEQKMEALRSQTVTLSWLETTAERLKLKMMIKNQFPFGLNCRYYKFPW